jgi:hypothetical protein
MLAHIMLTCCLLAQCEVLLYMIGEIACLLLCPSLWCDCHLTYVVAVPTAKCISCVSIHGDVDAVSADTIQSFQAPDECAKNSGVTVQWHIQQAADEGQMSFQQSHCNQPPGRSDTVLPAPLYMRGL